MEDLGIGEIIAFVQIDGIFPESRPIRYKRVRAFMTVLFFKNS